MSSHRIRTWHFVAAAALLISLVWLCRSPIFIVELVGQVIERDEVAATAASPDDKYVAMATISHPPSGPSLSVNVREGKGWFGIGTLRFGIGDDRWVAVDIQNKPSAEFQWLDERTLLVQYQGDMGYVLTDSWKDVHIIYRKIQ